METLNKVMNVYFKVEQESNFDAPYDNIYFLSLGMRAYYTLQEEVYQRYGISLERYLKGCIIVNPCPAFGENCFCVDGKTTKMGWIDSDDVIDIHKGY